MAKISVYLPEDLYRRAREKGLPISALAQEAIKSALDRDANAEWIERMRSQPRGITTTIDTAAVMAQVKDEWGT